MKKSCFCVGKSVAGPMAEKYVGDILGTAIDAAANHPAVKNA